MHDRANDGFGIDGAAVGLAPVPLPPAVLLLGAGVAALAGLAPPDGGAPEPPAPAPAGRRAGGRSARRLPLRGSGLRRVLARRRRRRAMPGRVPIAGDGKRRVAKTFPPG